MAQVLNENGFDTLAFDFSGSGESDDSAITLDNQQDDLKCVIDYLVTKSYKKIVLFGNSLGTVSCLRNYRSEINAMVLIGALTGAMNYEWEDFFSAAQLEELREKGFFKLDNKRKHIITEQTLKDFEEIDQDYLMKNVDCPVLIVHGDHKEDKEELELLSHSRIAITKLPFGSDLKIISGGKHGFHNHWDELMDITCKWITNRI